MKRSHIILSSLALALAFTACQSPLDTDTPRVETPLTPAPKVDPTYVQQEFVTGDLRYTIVGSPSIKIDTSRAHMFFWFNLTMQESNPNADTLIKGFTLKVDSLEANGYTYRLNRNQGSIRMDLGRGPEDVTIDGVYNTATVLLEELPREQGKPRVVEITILIEGNKGGAVPGFDEQLVLGRLRVEI